MVFLIMNSIDILEELGMFDDDHDTFVERFHEDIAHRRHQAKRKDGAKSYWNYGYDTNSKSSLLFKEK